MPARDVDARLRVAGAALLAFLLLALAPSETPAAVPRSKDDRGFSIALVSPSDPYLTGRVTLRIEAIIPRSDTIEEADFFVDGRLLLVTQGEPFTCEHDFGSDIRRHVVEVRALTHEGRRAKVSFVSRSVDVTEGAAGAVATIAAVVRNAAGRPVPLLGVSDFALTEDGERRSIVHFSAGSSPASLAIVVEPKLRAERPESALASFLRDLPEHQAVTMVDAPVPPEPSASADAKTGPVWVMPATLAAAIQSGLPDGKAPLADALASAAALFGERRDPRVVLVLLALAPPPAPDPAPLPAPQAAAGKPAAAEKTATAEKTANAEKPASAEKTAAAVKPARAEDKADETASAADEALAAGLEAALKARAVIYVLAIGASDARVPAVLRDVSAKSGGQFLLAPEMAAVPQALRSLSDTLKNRYLITFMPSEPGRAGWHALDLAVRSPDLVVQAPRTLAVP
jgi:hypothetical protein